MNPIFGNTMLMTQKSLDFLWTKQNSTLNNIANNDTPGFKAQHVTFEESLQSKLQKGSNRRSLRENRREIEQSEIRIHDSNELSRADGNNVQMDVENVELARTLLQYQYQIQSLNNDISRLNTVIKGQ